MRIENQMLSRFQPRISMQPMKSSDISISNELDFFFNNVMDSVVEYFGEKDFARF